MARKPEESHIVDPRSPSRIEEIGSNRLLGQEASVQVYDRVSLEGALAGSIVKLFKVISSGMMNPWAGSSRTLVLIKLHKPLERVDDWWTLDAPVEYVEVIVANASRYLELQSKGFTSHLACSVYAAKDGGILEASQSDIFEQIVEIAKEADLKVT